MVRHLVFILAVSVAVLPATGNAATVNKRLSVVENRMVVLGKAVSSLLSANKKLGARIGTLEKRITSLEKRIAALESATPSTGVTVLDTSVTLPPSGLYPNDFARTIGLPNAQSPFVGHLWLSISVSYNQMNGGFLHYAVEPGTGGQTVNRCDGFSPNLWGSGVHTFTAYCNLNLQPGSGIRITAGSYDQGWGNTTAASAEVTGTLQEITRP